VSQNIPSQTLSNQQPFLRVSTSSPGPFSSRRRGGMCHTYSNIALPLLEEREGWEGEVEWQI